MRWTEIEQRVRETGEHSPTYRQMDLWTSKGLIPVEMKGDRRGRYRDWPDEAVETAFIVARLISAGLSQELAFDIAQTTPDDNGQRVAYLEAQRPAVRISVDV